MPNLGEIAGNGVKLKAGKDKERKDDRMKKHENTKKARGSQTK